MGKEILTFRDIEVEKINFTAIRLLFSEEVNNETLLASNMISFG